MGSIFVAAIHDRGVEGMRFHFPKTSPFPPESTSLIGSQKWRFLMGWYGYREYVPVATRRAQAKKKMEKLRKSGEEIQPIEALNSRGLIAKSFWGKAWCKHMQAFSDYANRLPRGRTYVRNGSVCHLAIEKEIAHAKVSGSEMYDLSIHFEPLDAKKWAKIKKMCKGKIGSLIELLQGKISDEIMAVVTDPKNGLFPHPKEIRFDCNCPDWAGHVRHWRTTRHRTRTAFQIAWGRSQ